MRKFKRFFTWKENKEFKEWLSYSVTSGNEPFFTKLYHNGATKKQLSKLRTKLDSYYGSSGQRAIEVLPMDVDDYKDHAELMIDLEKFVDPAADFLDQIYYNDWPQISAENLRHAIRKYKGELPKFQQQREYKWFLRNLGIPPKGMSQRDYFNDRVKMARRKGQIKLLYRKNGIYIFRVKTHKAFETLGLLSWCLKDRGQWNNYVAHRPGRRQYVIVDYNKNKNDGKFAYAFTKKRGGKITHCFNNNNNEKSEHYISSYLDLIW